MKTPDPAHPAHRILLKAFVLPLVLATLAVGAPRGYSQNSAAAQATDQYEQLSPEALDELVSPFALYPDALIALILPASTVPSDVTLASRYLANGGTDFQNQSWDDSVISLSRYPEVVTWMDDNLAWTTAVGNAFLAQPVDVMNSLQRLRAAAAAAGNLNDTPEQRVVREVVEETTYIRIIPAQPDVIYVPTYDPGVVYYRQSPDYVGNIISFGAGFALGSWLNYDFDWGHRRIYYGDYNPGWNDRGRYDRGRQNVTVNNTEVNVTNITNTSANVWQPAAESGRQLQRRKANYNQRVRAANKEVRAAQREAKENPNRKRRQIEALPQPEPLVTDGGKGRKRTKANAGDSPAEDARNRNGKKPRTPKQGEVAVETIPPTTESDETRPRGGKSKKDAPLPNTTPVVDGSAADIPKDASAKRNRNRPTPNTPPVVDGSTAEIPKDVSAKRNRNRPTPAQSAPSPATSLDTQKQPGTTEIPSSAPDGNRLMKKQENPGTKTAPDQRREGNEAKKNRKSSTASPSLQPSAPPTVPGSVQVPRTSPQSKEQQPIGTTPQQNARSSRKSNDRSMPTTQSPTRSQPERKAPTQVTTPRPDQNQPQRKKDRPSPPAQPQQQIPKVNRPNPPTQPQKQSRKVDRPSPQAQPQRQSPKVDRPNPPAQPQRQSPKVNRPNPQAQPQKQKSRDRQEDKQKQRSAPAAPSQPQKQRENKPERKQPQAATPSNAQPTAAPPSTEDGAQKKKKKKDK